MFGDIDCCRVQNLSAHIKIVVVIKIVNYGGVVVNVKSKYYTNNSEAGLKLKVYTAFNDGSQVTGSINGNGFRMI